MITSCKQLQDIFDELEPGKLELKAVVSGLTAPLGLAEDENGRLWVSEVGSGNSDGKVSVILSNGTKQVVVEDFSSVFNPQEDLGRKIIYLISVSL